VQNSVQRSATDATPPSYQKGIAMIVPPARQLARLLLVALALLLAACGAAAPASPPAAEGDADTPVALRMTVWTGSEAHLALLNGIAEAYRADHPNVSVQFDTIPFDDYTSKLTIQLAGGNPPDAGWILETTAPAFIDAGVLADIGGTLKGDESYDYADLSAPAMGLWTRSEAVYGVPFSTSPFVLFYNQDMFEAAGLQTPNELQAAGAWTWEALADAARTIAAENPGVYGFETVDNAGYSSRIWHNLVPIVRAYGGEAWADGTCTMASPEAVAAVQLYHDMVYVDQSAVPPGEQGDFYTGASAMTVGQLSRVSKLKDATFAWDIAPLPAGPAGQPAVVGQAALGVFNAGPHPEEAADFVAFMTNKENTAKLAQFFPPARSSVLATDAMATANPAINPQSLNGAIVTGIEQGVVLPSHSEFPKIDLAARAEFDKLWSPDADVAAVLGGVCAAIDPLLQP
jgi:multiple sugar transport system substrate-binding protein